MTDQPSDSTPNAPEMTTEEKLQQLIQQIRPYLQQDGGGQPRDAGSNDGHAPALRRHVRALS